MRVYRITEQSSYVRFVQRRKPILETSRVSLPRQASALTEPRAAKPAVPWCENRPTSRNIRSSTHYRKIGCAIRCCVSSSTESRYIDYILAIAVHFDLTHVKSATGQYQIASHFCSSSTLQHPARHPATQSIIVQGSETRRTREIDPYIPRFR